MAIFNQSSVTKTSRNGNVLLLATGVGKTQVSEPHFVVLNHLDHIGHGMLNLLKL